MGIKCRGVAFNRLKLRELAASPNEKFPLAAAKLSWVCHVNTV